MVSRDHSLTVPSCEEVRNKADVSGCNTRCVIGREWPRNVCINPPVMLHAFTV